MLESGSVKLRTIEPSDIDQLYAWENDLDLWKVSQTKVPFSKELLGQYISSAQDIYSHGQLRFIIEVDKEAVGTIDLFDYDAINSRAGVGIMIDSKFREKGVAKNALEIVVNYSKEILFLEQLYCNIIENNTASIKLFEGNDFVHTGTKEHWIRIEEGFENVLFYQLILSK
jgi:diamine N-acetyltransferase